MMSEIQNEPINDMNDRIRVQNLICEYDKMNLQNKKKKKEPVSNAKQFIFFGSAAKPKEKPKKSDKNQLNKRRIGQTELVFLNFRHAKVSMRISALEREIGNDKENPR